MKSLKFVTLALVTGLTAGVTLAADPQGRAEVRKEAVEARKMGTAPVAAEAGTPAPATKSTRNRAEVKSELGMANKTQARPKSSESEEVPMASTKSTRARSDVKAEVSTANKTGKHPQTGD